MPDFPRDEAVPTHVNSYMRWACLQQVRNLFTPVPGTLTWTANVAVYIPFWLPWPYDVQRMFWVNTGTLTGHCDIGVYSIDGALIWSAGSTAMSGTSAPQYVAPSPDFMLSPGRYFLALAHDSAVSANLRGIPCTAANGRSAGCYQQASAFPLPSSATFAAYAGVGYPLIGITNLPTGF